jgi:hypothetical protein
VQVLFTTVYSAQNLMRNERGVYTPALSELGVDQEACRRYNCLLTLSQDGKDYRFHLEKDVRAWTMRSGSPVPQEEKP